MSTTYIRPAVVETRRIQPAHLQELEASTIDFNAAALSGVYTLSHEQAYEGGIRGQGGLGGLCYRYWEPDHQRFSMRFFRVKPDAMVEGRKYLQPVGERPRLYFVAGTSVEDLADATAPVFIPEGEKKTLALHFALLAAGIRGVVVGIGGVWGWRYSPREPHPNGKLEKGRSRPIPDLDLVQWESRRVYLVFDSDIHQNWKVATAETALARALASRGAEVFIIRLPKNSMAKIGIDDLLVAQGTSVLTELINNSWRFDGEACPERAHLSDIENASLGRKRILIDLRVSAVGDSFLLPWVIDLRCSSQAPEKGKPRLCVVQNEDEAGPEDDGDHSGSGACPHSSRNEGRWQHEVVNPEVLIDLTRVPVRQLRKRLGEYARSLCPNALYLGPSTRQTVTSILATPKARRVRSAVAASAVEVVDESGKPFREKVLYVLGQIDKSSRYYRGLGVAVPNPKTQEATAFLWSLEPLDEDFDNFHVTPEHATAFRSFQADPGQATVKLYQIGNELTEHLTQIYGTHRVLSLIGKLLVFHSVCSFSFDGEPLKRGWLEMLEVGDTGQGKTQQVDRILATTGMGEVVDGVSTTRTGLAYCFHKLNDLWFLVWGKYPLNDGRLLFIDEAQTLHDEDIDKIRKGRSDGLISADGVRSGEHPTRTRLIMACNPRFQGVVDDQLFGIELLKQTFKDEDIRRFDFAIISSSSDDKADINQPRKSASGSPSTGLMEALGASIRWAWSRKPGDVEFEPEATEQVYLSAQVLTEMYGAARDTPLALESDIRIKVARMAVAVATLLHSTDETHKRVIVRVEHILAVGEFLVAIYDHPNCSLDLYAGVRRSESVLTDADYQDLWKEMRECQVEGTTRLGKDDINALLRAFVTHNGQIGRQDLAGELGKSAEWTSKVVRVLKVNKMIRVNKGRSGGYRATPRFTRFLKMAIAKGELEA